MSLEQDIRTVEIEMNLTGAVRDYAMFSELGNAAIHAVVVAAEAGNLTWKQVLGALDRLSREEPFAEATDTMVRECVYVALGFDRKGQDFYA
jgi:hypothetical protein